MYVLLLCIYAIPMVPCTLPTYLCSSSGSCALLLLSYLCNSSSFFQWSLQDFPKGMLMPIIPRKGEANGQEGGLYRERRLRNIKEKIYVFKGGEGLKLP